MASFLLHYFPLHSRIERFVFSLLSNVAISQTKNNVSICTIKYLQYDQVSQFFLYFLQHTTNVLKSKKIEIRVDMYGG